MSVWVLLLLHFFCGCDHPCKKHCNINFNTDTPCANIIITAKIARPRMVLPRTLHAFSSQSWWPLAQIQQVHIKTARFIAIAKQPSCRILKLVLEAQSSILQTFFWTIKRWSRHTRADHYGAHQSVLWPKECKEYHYYSLLYIIKESPRITAAYHWTCLLTCSVWPLYYDVLPKNAKNIKIFKNFKNTDLIRYFNDFLIAFLW